MMRNEKLRRLLAGLMAVLLLAALFPLSGAMATDDAETAAQPSASETETADAVQEEEDAEAIPENAIHIASAEDFLDFASSCTLDTWSQGKTFVLDADISLDGTDFSPIPAFSGTFLGGGHTIRGLNLTQSLCPAGLFSIVLSGARIENLNVEGTVCPSGESLSVGGIAGENHGLITGCSFTGTVSGTRNVGGIAGENASGGILRSCRTGGALFGENMSGGIAGCNLGEIALCQNNMYVNIESTDPTIRLQDINLDFSLDLKQLTQLSTAGVATDTGGIAGYSSGAILSCRNLAAIGYQHIGYNVGGIAGRTSGYILNCTNQGAVSGRKDVGGIAGQMEPYIRMELSESTLQTLQTQLGELNGLIEQASNDAEGSAGSISSRLNSMSGSVQNALNETGNLKAEITANGSLSGQGSHNSSTELDGTADIIDADASHGVGGGVTIDHEPGSITIGAGVGSGGEVNIGQAVDAALDHTGTAGGQVDGSATIVASPDLGGLTSAMSNVSSQLSLLNGALSGAAGTLASDVRAINEKFSELSDTLFDAMENVGSGDIITDVSTTDVDAITFGKLAESRNEAAIYGDINIGGIAGFMAIEYELDPEDDLTGQLSESYRRQYEYRAVIQRCVNEGSVCAKRNYSGGIAGRMDLGLITESENYGAAESESGNYVGGITGVTAATVRSCFAKCTLSGKRNVGGITGAGVAESASGSGSTVAGCYALVEIAPGAEYAGAISGTNAGSFVENFFVSDSLAGINRQSYSGAAEPIAYEDLLQVEALPEAMQRFTLRFVVDDETVSATTFSYGDSFDETIFPELPEKDGCSAAWDHDTLQDLHFDTTVTAVYTPYVPCLASGNTREDGRPVILAEGDYTDAASVTVTAQPLTPGAFGVRSGSLGSRIAGYFSGLSDRRFPVLVANWEVVEQWSVELENAGNGGTIRYLAPDGTTDHLRVYVRQGGSWEETACGTFGSYLTIPIQGTSAEIAIIRTFPVFWFWIAAAVLILVLVLLIVLLIHRARRKRHPDRKKAPTAPEPPAASGTPEDDALLARAEAAEERLARLEEELRALREAEAAQHTQAAAPSPAQPDDAPAAEANPSEPAQAESPVQQTAPEESSEPKEKPEPEAPARRKKKHWWIPVLLVLLAGAAAAGFFLNSGLKTDLDAYRLLSAYLEQDPSAASLNVEAALNGTVYRTSAEITRTHRSGKAVTCVEQDGVRLYYTDGTLYLENGNAYETGTLYPDYSQLLQKASELYELVKVEQTKSGTQKQYTIRVTGDDAAALLQLLVPTAEDLPELISTIDLELTAENGTLQTLHFFTSGSLQSGASLDAVLTVEDTASAAELPTAVQEAMDAGSTGTDTVTEELFRLLQAGTALLQQDSVSADIAISASCGPIVADTTLQYDARRSAGQNIGCIRKDSLALYFSGDRLCDQEGHTVRTDDGLVDTAELWKLAYQLVLNGSFTCSRAGNAYVYALQLDEAGMEAVAYAILPEAQGQNLSLSSGSVSLTIADGAITSIQATCSGSVQLALTSAGASLSSQITFTKREAAFPQAVLDALKS